MYMYLIQLIAILENFCIPHNYVNCISLNGNDYDHFIHLKYFNIPRSQISSWVITTHCRLYSNISQILLLHQTWQYYNKIDSMKSSGVRHGCVTIPQLEHGLKDIAFYVQKPIPPSTVVITSLLVRDKPLVMPPSVQLFYSMASLTAHHIEPSSKELHFYKHFTYI